MDFFSGSEKSSIKISQKSVLLIIFFCSLKMVARLLNVTDLFSANRGVVMSNSMVRFNVNDVLKTFESNIVSTQSHIGIKNEI